MKTYLAYWPDKSLSILRAENIKELFRMLDEEGDPNCAKIYTLPEGFHLGSVMTVDGKSIRPRLVSVNDRRLKRFKFPHEFNTF